MSEVINHLEREVDATDRAQAQAVALCRRMAGMGHDLKTPLNAIMGYTELLLEEFEEVGATDKVADLRKILRSGSPLLGMIEDLVRDAAEVAR
jgi:signal transduction histidine kinase